MKKLADVFENATFYKLFQFLVIPQKSRKYIENNIISVSGVESVLDFGCGVGYHAEYFEFAEYLGIEPLESCVAKANQLFAKKGTTFKVGDHNTLKNINDESFDLIIAIGVLHHIEDEIVDLFIGEAKRLLKPGGRLTTFDPVIHSDQTFPSKWVVSQDRGRYVRRPEEYSEFFKTHFDENISSKVHSGLLRIPYDHIHFHAIKG